MHYTTLSFCSREGLAYRPTRLLQLATKRLPSRQLLSWAWCYWSLYWRSLRGTIAYPTASRSYSSPPRRHCRLSPRSDARGSNTFYFRLRGGERKNITTHCILQRTLHTYLVVITEQKQLSAMLNGTGGSHEFIRIFVYLHND